MGTKDDLNEAVDNILKATWNERDGTVVPRTDDVALKNGAVKLDAVLLYCDLANSTDLASIASRKVAAKVVRTFLAVASHLVKAAGGEIRSFDGDRVMGVFVGSSKNSSAAECGLHIKYGVNELLAPRLEDKYPSLFKSWALRHCTGVASGEVFVARAGVRGSNDLVFVGPPPNTAAKLSDIRDHPYSTYITAGVYSFLNENAKFSRKDGSNMWSKTTATVNGKSEVLYRSSWWREP